MRHSVKPRAEALAIALALATCAAPAMAGECLTCDNAGGLFVCAAGAPAGGYQCFSSLFACAVAVPCPGTFPRMREAAYGARPIVVHAAVWDIDPAAPARRAGGRVLRGEAGGALAALGQRIAREGYGARSDRLLDAAVTVANGALAAAVRTERGDGWAIRVQSAGAGHRVVVREVEGGRLARTLVSDFVGERDLLLAPVRLEGRPALVALWLAAPDGGAAALRDLQLRLFEQARALGAAGTTVLRLEPREAAEF